CARARPPRREHDGRCDPVHRALRRRAAGSAGGFDRVRRRAAVVARPWRRVRASAPLGGGEAARGDVAHVAGLGTRVRGGGPRADGWARRMTESFDAGWLGLREPVDHRSRASELLAPLRAWWSERE